VTWLWIVSAASLIATWMNIHHRAECFAIWTATNSIWAAVDWCAGIHAQAALHMIYIVLAVHGYRAWTARGDAHGKAHSS
jgi:nicotinamide riboside transporter PnuC